MIRLANIKIAGLIGVTPRIADAYDPPIEHGAYDVILCRHLLWAMPEPVTALKNWTQLLAANGAQLLVEGRWNSDIGLTAEQAVALVQATSRTADLTRLSDPIYWGRSITDDRYLITSLAS